MRVNLSPPARFLLRCSATIIVLLTVWWVALFNPLLFLLRIAAGAGGALFSTGDSEWSVSENPNRDWTFTVPVDAILPPAASNQAPRILHSIHFDLARSDAGGFTFGLPVFWGIMLAAPKIRNNLRATLAGTLWIAALEVALVLVTAEIEAHSSMAQLVGGPNPVREWLLRFGGYLSVNAIPYLLPFAVAIGLHGELRAQILRLAAPAAAIPAQGVTRRSRAF